MLSFTRYVFSCLFTIVFFLPAVAYAAQDAQSILIICSYNPAAHQTSVTISDFMDEYTKCGGKYNIEIENMNCKSFSESPKWKGMMQQILSRYKGNERPELIILLGQEAWAAYLSQEDSLVANIPVMCSLTSRNAVILPEDTTDLKEWMPETVDFFSDHLGHRRVKSGFIYDYDIEGNIRMILHFYPDTRHIAFISDNSYGGVAMQALVREEMKKFPGLDLILLDGRSNTIYSIMDKFHHLPEHTAAMVGTWRVDMNESYFMRNATYMMMEANPNVPAFAPASVGLGYWTIGGVIPAYRPLGRDMAREAIRKFANPNDTACHVEVIGSKNVLDYKKVKELKLDVKSFPADMEIINQPVSFYQQYTYQIWSACALFVILVLGLCISLFYYFRTKRLKDELLKSEKDLRVAKDRAEESNRLKSAFLANMSHEIRTPLNAIVGFSSLMVDTEDMEERRQYMDIVEENNDLLLQLISDILDLSKIEAGTFDFTEREVDVNLLCEDIVLAMRMKARPNVEILFDRHLPECRIMSDRNRLHQVISNFVNNALKFTEEGNIRVGYDQLDEAHLCFYVADTGIGIEPEMQNEIFERFVKLNSFVHGTGLGLSICRSIVEQLGGEIGVDSEPEKGSCCWFTLPIK